MEQAESAEFSDEFIGRVATPAGRRQAVEEEILNGGYFTPEEAGRLTKELSVISASFNYETALKAKIQGDFKLEGVAEGEPEEKTRDYAFARIVKANYKHTCAICGVSVLIEDISVVDAAHILPFHQFHNDDPRNGLALCKTHHWLFDRGGLTITPAYRVLISHSRQVEHPEGVL
ncbi:MAG: HNH endonuclease [Planctomycetota bacterium]